MAYLKQGYAMPARRVLQRRGLGGVCIVDPSDGVLKDSDTGVPCATDPLVSVDSTPVVVPLPCLSGSGPLQPGQSYCYGNTPSGLTPQAASSVNVPLVAAGIGLVAALLLMKQL